MQFYKNLGGDSGVRSFEIGNDYITVQFNTGSAYLYNYNSAGASNIEIMKRLAIGGRGLNSFINTHVKDKYAYKIR